VCSTGNISFVRELGADHVIDYTRDDFTSLGTRYDVIFDAVAKSSYWKCRKALQPDGRYITTLPSPSALFFQLTTRFGRRCRNMLARPDRKDLQWLAQQISDEQIRPVVQHAYSLENASAAHQASEAGHVRGKLVLTV